MASTPCPLNLQRSSSFLSDSLPIRSTKHLQNRWLSRMKLLGAHPGNLRARGRVLAARKHKTSHRQSSPTRTNRSWGSHPRPSPHVGCAPDSCMHAMAKTNYSHEDDKTPVNIVPHALYCPLSLLCLLCLLCVLLGSFARPNPTPMAGLARNT